MRFTTTIVRPCKGRGETARATTNTTSESGSKRVAP
jgi:hypothetical protein